MFKLSLRAETGEYISLDAWLDREQGVQILSGLTGMGMPPVANQWLEGAGDGATHRGRRFLPRTLDLPIMLTANSRTGLEWWARRLSRMFTGKITLFLVDDAGWIWKLYGVYEGGAEYTYGDDTIGTQWLYMTFTIKCGDPFWVRTQTLELPNMGRPDGKGEAYGWNLPYSVDNIGDVDTYPRWIIDGPTTYVKLTSPKGEEIILDRPIPAGRSVIIDTAKGTIVNDEGGNWYDWFGPAPVMWPMRPGVNDCTVKVSGASTGSVGTGAIHRSNYFPNPRLYSQTPIYAPNVKVTSDEFTRFIVGAGKHGWGGAKVDNSALAGRTLTLSTYAKIDGGPTNAQARVRCFAYNGGEFIGSYDGEWGSLKTTWNRFTKSFTVDSSATILYCVIEADNSDNSQEILFDTKDWMLENGLSASSPFDGSSQANSQYNYTWDGEPHNSNSRERSISYEGATLVRCEINPRQGMMI